LLALTLCVVSHYGESTESERLFPKRTMDNGSLAGTGGSQGAAMGKLEFQQGEYN
jgi:hypothetical protein